MASEADRVRGILAEGGYTSEGLCLYGEKWMKDADHKALMSGWRLLVCSFGVWRSFSFSDAVLLGTDRMERIVRMRPNAEGVEDTTQYALWLTCDLYKAKGSRELREGL